MSLVKVAEDNQVKNKVYDYLKKTYPVSTLKWVKDADWKRKKNVPLDKVKMARRPGGAREPDKVKGIAGAIKDGEKMEPVVLVKLPNGEHKIADGYHRTLGTKHAGRKTVDAYVGDVKEAKGAWDKEMHEKKKNVGKSASTTPEGLAKVAVVGALAKGVGSLAKSTGKMVKDTADDLTGGTVRKAQQNKDDIMQASKNKGSDISSNDIKDANKDLRKAKFRQGTTRVSGAALGGGAAYQGMKNHQNKNNVDRPDVPSV